jgi:uncharacterized protein
MKSNQLIGVGLRHPHYTQVIAEQPPIGWFEVHSENFFHAVPALNSLRIIRNNYPISLHGIGLSLGSADGLITSHLNNLNNLIKEIDPFLISEHLSWGYISGTYLSDLLPIPYNEDSLNIFIKNIDQTQNFLKREILIENPSSYLEYNASNMVEVDFLVSICQRTGAKILLDVNNIFVSCYNHKWNPKEYIDKIPVNLVKEIHLAGHSTKYISENDSILIDTHDNIICKEVWDLYAYTIKKFRGVHTLIEWDINIPKLSTLIEEANKAKVYLESN